MPKPDQVFVSWGNRAQFEQGHINGLQLVNDGLRLMPRATQGEWISPLTKTGFSPRHIVPSWRADVQDEDSFLTFSIRVFNHGSASDWLSIGHWGIAGDRYSTADLGKLARVDVDTLLLNRPVTGFQMKASFSGASGRSPVLRNINAMAWSTTDLVKSKRSRRLANHIDLPVPQITQMAFAGGETMCSPTCVAMVLNYWRQQPVADELDGRDLVEYIAKEVYDSAYKGAGNWAFNTAVASEFDLDGSVRHFRSLNDAERYVRAGIPVVASINWDNTSADAAKHLDGAHHERTPGHLLVIRGFTSGGDVIVNDPACKSDDEVRNVYDRDQFEHRWFEASQNIGYVIHPIDFDLTQNFTQAFSR